MKRTIVVIVLAALLLLTACGSQPYGGNSAGVDAHIGREGITLDFLQQAPPDDVNEQQVFGVEVSLHNKGAYDIINDESITLELLYDTAYVAPARSGNIPGLNQGPRNVQLHGKSFNYQQGEQDFFSLGTFEALNIIGGFKTAEPTFYVNICYPYQTHFSAEVCVDTDVTNADPRQQVCEAQKKYTFNQGQGAPIAVTSVEIDFQPIGPFVKPVITLVVENVGSGFSAYEANSFVPQCDHIVAESINRASFNAILSDTQLICPTEIYFKDGKAEVDCFYPGDGFLQTAANFLGVLTANITYHYSQQYSESMTIERLHQYYQDNRYSNGECAPWEEEYGGRCITRCEYCAKNPGAEGCTADELTKTGFPTAKTPGSQYSCVYDKLSCVRAGDNCINDEGSFCVPGTYCGLPACALSDSKNSKPTVARDEGAQTSQFTWYCQDYDNSELLADTCGCQTTSEYAVLLDSKDSCEKLASTAFQTHDGGSTTYATRKTYFTLSRDQIPVDAEALCVRVSDNQGATRLGKILVK